MRKSFAAFGDYFGRFSIFFRRVIYRNSILPSEKESKIAPKEPQNQRKFFSTTVSSEVFHSFSSEETIAWAAKMAVTLSPGDVVLLTGDLGAGKTTLVQGLVQGLSSSDLVQSPTYVYLQIYEGAFPIYHFDLYRLTSVDDFLAMGFEEFFYKNGICLIEWPERIRPLLPEKAIWIESSAKGENERIIHIKRTSS